MKAILTGSFDPITIGHIEIIKKARDYFEKLYVVALLNADKEYTFSLEEKKELMELSLVGFDNVVVDAFDGLAADYMHMHGISNIVRGIRNEQDKIYEQKLADAMKKFDKNFETIFVESPKELQHISSTRVRDKLKNGESIDGLVAESAKKRMIEIYSQK